MADDGGLTAANDFKDPLGAKDTPDQESESDEIDFDYYLSQISPQLSEQQKVAYADLAHLQISQTETREIKDLSVTVDNPEKHVTTLESYITFRVTMKTTRSDFDSPEYQVRRRYNDFLWLRQRLEETHPCLLVPPLPEKHSLKRLDRFNQEFVKTRMSALHLFMSRVADHPVLSFNDHFKTFLTAKQAGLQAAKKEGTGFISRFADSFHNISASYMMKTRTPEFVAMNDYINTFSEKLGVLDRISQRIFKEQYDYLTELNEWGPEFTLWSSSEDKLNQALVATAKAVEQNFTALQKLVDSSETKFSNPIKEYMLYADAIKVVLRKRDAIQMEYEMTLEEFNRKKVEKEQGPTGGQSFSIGSFLGKDSESARQSKLDRMDEAIHELSKQVETLSDRATCSNADLKADLDRWHKTKRRDFRELFTAMADRQIDYYQQCVSAWEAAIPLIQKTDVAVDNGVHDNDE